MGSRRVVSLALLASTLDLQTNSVVVFLSVGQFVSVILVYFSWFTAEFVARVTEFWVMNSKLTVHWSRLPS